MEPPTRSSPLGRSVSHIVKDFLRSSLVQVNYLFVDEKISYSSPFRCFSSLLFASFLFSYIHFAVLVRSIDLHFPIFVFFFWSSLIMLYPVSSSNFFIYSHFQLFSLFSSSQLCLCEVVFFQLSVLDIVLPNIPAVLFLSIFHLFLMLASYFYGFAHFTFSD